VRALSSAGTIVTPHAGQIGGPSSCISEVSAVCRGQPLDAGFPSQASWPAPIVTGSRSAASAQVGSSSVS
jgi:hypothetical protein